jgi:hypothetical protein
LPPPPSPVNNSGSSAVAAGVGFGSSSSSGVYNAQELHAQIAAAEAAIDELTAQHEQQVAQQEEDQGVEESKGD